MTYLALHHAQKYPVRKDEVAGAEGISADYVQQIMMKLKAADLIQSRRGVNGGFMLARAPSQITALDIVIAMEGPLAIAPCQEAECVRAGYCKTRGLWEKASEAFKSVLAETTVAELANDGMTGDSSKSVAFEI